MSSAPPPPPPPSSPPPPPPPPGGGYVQPAPTNLASAGMRVLARFLDGVILGLAFGAVFAAIVLSDGDSAGFAGIGGDASFGQAYTIAILGAIVGFVWDAVCTKMWGGTPMKLAFGMKVVQADSGADVEWEHAIKRWALPGALALISRSRSFLG